MTALYNLIGLCAKAGRLVSGAQAVEQALKKNEARVVILDQNASELTRKSAMDACSYRGVRLLTIKDAPLGHMIGKPGRMACAVTDAGFAGKIIELYDTEDG